MNQKQVSNMFTLFDDESFSRTKIYTINGEPVPLARPRLGRQPYSRVYDTQKQLKLLAGIGLHSQHNDEPMFEGQLYVDIVFYMKMPQSTPKKRVQLQGTYCTSRPDIDNCCKFYLDVMTGIIYHDDAIICCMTLKKIYDLEPRTVITVSEFK